MLLPDIPQGLTSDLKGFVKSKVCFTLLGFEVVIIGLFIEVDPVIGFNSVLNEVMDGILGLLIELIDKGSFF
jgi:hypothetical protein